MDVEDVEGCVDGSDRMGVFSSRQRKGVTGGWRRSKGSVRGDENPGLRAGEGKDTRGRWRNRKISGFDIA